MKPGLTEIVFIMDKSIGAPEDDSINTLVTILKRQKTIIGDCTITTVAYTDKYEVRHDRQSIHKIKKSEKKSTASKGGVAFLDAIGATIDNIGLALHNTPEHERPEKVIFVIIANKPDTASYKYTLQKVSEQITTQTRVYNWSVIFLGSSINIADIAGGLQIAPAMTAEFLGDSKNVKKLITSLGDMINEIRSNSLYLANQYIEKSLSELRASFYKKGSKKEKVKEPVVEKPKGKVGRPKKVRS